MHINDSQKKSKENNNSGLSIWKNLIILSFPIAIYLLFQHLGSSIDYYIVGDFKKTSNVDSTITYMKQIKKVLQSIAIALGGAGVVLVAREYKKNNKKLAEQYATLGFLLAVIISLFIILVFGLGVYLPSFLGDLFLSRNYHSDGGLIYYYLSLFTFVFITINSVFIGLERAKSKTKFVLFLNVLNITTRIFLSFYYKHALKGDVTVINLATADLLSNLLISLIAFYFMMNPKNDFQLKFKNLTFPKDIVKTMLKLSGTLIIGKATYEIGKKFILDMTTEYWGKELVAMSGFVAVVNGICYAISQSFEDAQSAMVSQSASVESDKNIFKIFKNVFVITLILGIIGVILNTFFGEQLLKLLKPNKTFSNEEFEQFKEILFWEQTSLFTSVWASMMMGYILAYKKNANIFLLMNILRIILRMSCLW
ncbi:sodium transporter, partial [Candidatus Phytoplasma phoenicium]